MKTGEHTPVGRFDRFRVRKDRNRAIGAVVVVVAALVVIAFGATSIIRDTGGYRPAGTGGPPVPSDIGAVTITNTGCTLDGAMDPGPGPFTLEVINETTGAKTFVVFKIANHARFARMLAFVERVRPRFGNPAHGPGHASEDERLVQSRFFEYASTSETEVEANESLVVPGAFDPGTYGIECVGRPPERGSPRDFIGPIHVRSG